MKLLLDQNLSWRLVEALQDLFPDTKHVREVGLDRAPDEEVWRYAREEGFVIISKDADFEQRSFLRGHPPKCIWLRVGNCTTESIPQLVRENSHLIHSFGSSEEESYLIMP